MTDHAAELRRVASWFEGSVPSPQPRRMTETLRAAAERIEELEAAMSQTEHVLVLDPDGWAIEHLVECRRDGMTNCPYHRAADQLEEPPAPAGRYRMTNLDPLELEPA